MPALTPGRPAGPGLRVLHVTSSFPRRADDPVAPYLLDLAVAQQDAGLQVRVLAPHDAGAARSERLAGVGVRRCRYAPSAWQVLAYRGGLLGRARTPAVLLLPALLLALAAATVSEVLRRRPDVVHAHWWLPAGLCALPAARLLRRPLVVTVHGSDAALLRRPVVGRLGVAVLRAADLVTVVSEDLRRTVADATGLPPGRLVEVTLPVAATRAGPLPPAPPVRLLAAGRLSPEKGFDVLVTAVSLAVRDGLDVRLVLVGSGPEQARLARLAAPLGARVVLLPAAPRERVWSLMAQAHAVVVPSRREGLGLVAAEALARGRPVVASDVGGLPEVLSAPGAGVLVPPDDPAALAAALRRLPLPAPPPARLGPRAPQASGQAFRAAYEALCGR